MATLRTQVDSLQWEVNRLDVENRKLRSQNVDAGKQVDMELQVEQFKEEASKAIEEFLAMKEVLAKKQANFEQEIRATGEKLEESTVRLQSVEAELFNLRELQKEPSSQGKEKLLAMKEALAKKQADFEKELDKKDERLAEATTRLQLADT
ncbi:moesin-like [Dysidea avara]|uniref:moesin-like n=1 Tax=Dysidea avara TaxID=196820 RepID=UPI00331DD0E8